MRSQDATREPCPDRIIDDFGGSFAMGSIGGAVWHFLKGVHGHPRGHRLSGGLQSARMNAARTGGAFAVWGGMFSATDCAMVYLRQKEDPWNNIISGAVTGGLFSVRQGLRRSVGSAVALAGLMALVEGLTVMVGKGEAVVRRDAQISMSTEEEESRRDGETKVLESFFDEPVPVPTFETPN